ncbi:MAG: cytochrome c biogenesis protein [Deltaproteobacteria bacterium]|nr:cytochrome c biogenesis protein [Deltaproteobacteria bacterium]
MIGALFWIPVGLYLAGWLAEFIRFWRGSGSVFGWGGWVMAMGWGAHTLFLFLQAQEAGANLALALGVLAWAAIPLNFLAQRRFRNTVFGFIFPPFSISLLLVTGLLTERGLVNAQELGLDPALTYQAVLVVHIVSFLAGHVLFALACLLGIIFLYEEHQIKAKLVRMIVSRVPSLGALDHLNERAVVMGFFFLSLGIMLGIGMGGVETFPRRMAQWRTILPMVTWGIYAAYLVERFFNRQQGRYMAIWSIAGFLVVAASLVVEMSVLWARV